MKVNNYFSIDEIKHQTGRILNSPLFKNSPILSRFLEFIIAETFDNRELQIKEYSIAIHVLDRSRDFNPKGDSIVRIHAGRLRRALTEYYLTNGIYDPIIIQIPKGCYVPEFIESGTEKPKFQQTVILPREGHKSLVAVFPLRVSTHEEDIEELHELLEEQLGEELLKFHDIAVIGYYSMDMKAKIKQNILEAGKMAGADYIITGSIIYSGQHLRVLINLLVTSTGEVLQSKSFERNILPPALIEIQDEIFQNVIGFVNGCYKSIIQENQKSAKQRGL
jgi:TolB-like protein